MPLARRTRIANLEGVARRLVALLLLLSLLTTAAAPALAPVAAAAVPPSAELAADVPELPAELRAAAQAVGEREQRLRPSGAGEPAGPTLPGLGEAVLAARLAQIPPVRARPPRAAPSPVAVAVGGLGLPFPTGPPPARL